MQIRGIILKLSRLAAVSPSLPSPVSLSLIALRKVSAIGFSFRRVWKDGNEIVSIPFLCMDSMDLTKILNQSRSNSVSFGCLWTILDIPRFHSLVSSPAFGASALRSSVRFHRSWKYWWSHQPFSRCSQGCKEL